MFWTVPTLLLQSRHSTAIRIEFTICIPTEILPHGFPMSIYHRQRTIDGIPWLLPKMGDFI